MGEDIISSILLLLKSVFFEIAFKSNLQAISENISLFLSNSIIQFDLSSLIYHSFQMTYNYFHAQSTFKNQRFFQHWR